MRISYVGFWPGFNPKALFTPLLEQSIARDLVKAQDIAVRVDSVFKPGLRGLLRGAAFDWHKGRQLKIWYTGEWKEAPQGYDLTLSFSPDSETNIYFPVAFLSVNWFAQSASSSIEAQRAGKYPKPDELAAGRVTDTDRRRKFACAFIGNPEPTRMKMIDQLRRLGEVDVFGGVMGSPVPRKLEVAQIYRFMLCFENRTAPGYVTEKPLDAWLAGCVPLWRGIDDQGLLNRRALLNAFDYDSDADFLEHVRAVDQDENEILRITSEPLTKAQWSLFDVQQRISNIVGS